ncbi:hypothetical protein J3F84DRAFT_221785 [Trichoderma pleuroticola]
MQCISTKPVMLMLLRRQPRQRKQNESRIGRNQWDLLWLSKGFAPGRRFLILLGPPRPARLAESTARNNLPPCPPVWYFPRRAPIVCPTFAWQNFSICLGRIMGHSATVRHGGLFACRLVLNPCSTLHWYIAPSPLPVYMRLHPSIQALPNLAPQRSGHHRCSRSAIHCGACRIPAPVVVSRRQLAGSDSTRRSLVPVKRYIYRWHHFSPLVCVVALLSTDSFTCH